MAAKAGHNASRAAQRRISPAQRVLYAPLGLALGLLGRLPLPALYPLADLLAFTARHIVRYRRRLVSRNITDSFPDLSPAALRKIERGFYRRLGQYFIETLRTPFMSEEEMRRRMTFSGTELVDRYLEQGRDIVIYTSHFGNWEWITSMGLWCRSYPACPFAHVYRPLRNPWFDRWWLSLRGRFNTSIPMKGVLRRLLQWRRQGTRWITGFLSDQKPSHAGTSVTVDFLGRPTPFIYGTEELARKLDAVVLLFDTETRGRGRYHSTIRLITEAPREMPEGEITRRYAESLSAQIRRSPDAYLWSHNRWRLPRR